MPKRYTCIYNNIIVNLFVNYYLLTIFLKLGGSKDLIVTITCREDAPFRWLLRLGI